MGGHPIGDENELLKQELGWYVANSAESTAAVLLESIVIRQVRTIADAPEDEGDVTGELVDKKDLDPKVRLLFAKGRAHRKRGIREILAAFGEPPALDEPFATNLRFTCEEFGLGELDAEIIRLILRYSRNDALECFADSVLTRLHYPARAVATLIGADVNEVADRIGWRGELVTSGILFLNSDKLEGTLVGEGGALKLTPPLQKAMRMSFRSREEWRSALFGEPVPASLGWEDFGHLGTSRDLAAKVLAGSANSASTGVNILVHGSVGTGKTEFCKSLAAQVGVPIWSVGEADGEEGEPERSERLAALHLAQRLLAKRQRALVLFDEAEDVLEGPTRHARLFMGTGRVGSKVHVNRFIEQNPVPILWTCNDVEGIDPAILRRMTLTVEIKTPTAPIRARIWRRVVADTKAPIDEAAIERFSRMYDTPPAVAANAVRAALLAGGGTAEAEEAMGGVLRLLGVRPCVPGADGTTFDPKLTNCDADLAHLVDVLARPGAPRDWSLCVQGPPGTGKSQFARHIASKLDLAVMHKRASDLLSCWVGDTEKQIAAAFAAARAERAMLVIDEAESLLYDRRSAARGWELTQVNEMLTWMENHPLPVVCTTNLSERLDQASYRRFTLKLRFETLTQAQAALAFERFFGAPAPRRLPDGLAPGDFAIVRRKREIFTVTDTKTLLGWLEEEAAAKGVQMKPLGFTAGSA